MSETIKVKGLRIEAENFGDLVEIHNHLQEWLSGNHKPKGRISIIYER